MKIYVVEGHTGEYSDRNDWPVKAFVHEPAAQAFVDACTKEILPYNIKNKYDAVNWERIRNAKSPLDPNLQIDYTGTHYDYYEVELETN